MKTRFVIFAAALLVGCDDYGECLESHKEPLVYYVQSGKVLVPIVSEHTVCDRWEFPEGKP